MLLAWVNVVCLASGLHLTGIRSSRARHALAGQSSGDPGETESAAVTLREIHLARGRKSYAARLAKYGEEGMRELAEIRGRMSAASKLEKYGEEGLRELGRKANVARLEKYGEAGARAQSAAGGRKSAAAMREKHGEDGLQMIGIDRGRIAALNNGKRFKYAGVIFVKNAQKWLVQFTYASKRHYVGYHATELEGARAHDRYVRENGLKRPLHLPDA